MLGHMRLLLLDTCGDTGSLALAEHGRVVRERVFAARTASANLVAGIREELSATAWSLRSLGAVVVVNGPGSFTGVRVGLAAAKGLCEVTGLPLLALSRLAVLQQASRHGREAVAVLDAGRGEFYVRLGIEERLLGLADVWRLAGGASLAIAEEKLTVTFAGFEQELVPLHARHALPLALATLAAGGDDVSIIDVNYVRPEQALYAARHADVGKPA